MSQGCTLFSFARKQGNLRTEPEKHDECAICYDSLSSRPVGVMLCQSSAGLVKSCNHSFHQDCLSGLRKPWLCPLCRKAFVEIQSVPVLNTQDRQSADIWYAHLDSDKDGSLSFEEIADGLKAQVSLEWKKIESEMDNMWSKWDKNGDCKITKDEFLRPGDGLLDYLIAHYGSKPKDPPPDITKDKVAWFQYWDDDHSGHLSKDEVARALVKTFKLFDVAPSQVLEVVDVIWPMFDYDGSNFIDMVEFCAPDNLGETIVAQLTVGRL